MNNAPARYLGAPVAPGFALLSGRTPASPQQAQQSLARSLTHAGNAGRPYPAHMWEPSPLAPQRMMRSGGEKPMDLSHSGRR